MIYDWNILITVAKFERNAHKLSINDTINKDYKSQLIPITCIFFYS